MSERPGAEVGVDFNATSAEFVREAHLDPERLSVGDILTINTTDSYTGEGVDVRLPVVRVNRTGIVHGDHGKSVIVDYGGRQALIAGSVFSSIGRSGPTGITAGTYPLLSVFQAGKRPSREVLGLTNGFKVERPDGTGLLHELALNALDRREPYEKPNQELIAESDNVLADAIHTILPDVDLKYGVRGTIDAGESSMLLDIKSDCTEIFILNKTTGKLTKLSRFSNGSLAVRNTDIPSGSIDEVSRTLGWGSDPVVGDITRVEFNFSNQDRDLDGAVSISLSPADSEAMGLETKSHFQTLYGDGILSQEYAFREEPALLALKDGVPTLLSKPEKQFDPVEAANEVLHDVTAALRSFEMARSNGDVTAKLHRSILVEGGLSVEDLPIPMPDSLPNTAPESPKGWKRFARAAKTLIDQTVEYIKR